LARSKADDRVSKTYEGRFVLPTFLVSRLEPISVLFPLVEGYDWCASIDLKSFVDEIPHNLVLKLIWILFYSTVLRCGVKVVYCSQITLAPNFLIPMASDGLVFFY
jgi:hypothetical protein